MGRVVYDSANKVTYDVLRAFNWPEYDGYHYEYRSDPWAGDIDGDGLEDEDELEAGTNPFKKDDPFLVEAVSGFVLGDIGLSNPKHANTAYLGGSIASGLVPVVEWVATVRDVIANSWRGDWGTAGITAGAGLLSALPATVVADEVPEMAAKVVKFVRAYPGKVTDAGKYIVKTVPDHSIGLLDDIYDGAVTLLKNKGLSDEGAKALAGSKVPLKEFNDNVDSVYSFIKTADGPVTDVTRHGIHVEVRNIDDGAKFISDLGGAGLSKGELGERATYWVIEKKGFKPLGESDGFYKNLVNQEGIDLIYKDGDTFVIVESKFTSSGGNVGKGILTWNSDKSIRQMDDAWIKAAIKRMEDKNLISTELADDLLDAKRTGNLRKELVVVQNVPTNGKTVVESLTESKLNIRNVELIKIGEVIP
jgi:Holliday junction resolvase-like predicted endonuclease